MTLTAFGESAPGKPCKDERRAINRFMAAVRNAHRASDARAGPNQSKRTVGLEHRRRIGRHAHRADQSGSIRVRHQHGRGFGWRPDRPAQSRRLWLGYQPRGRLRCDRDRPDGARPRADPARPAHHGRSLHQACSTNAFLATVPGLQRITPCCAAPGTRATPPASQTPIADCRCESQRRGAPSRPGWRISRARPRAALPAGAASRHPDGV